MRHFHLKTYQNTFVVPYPNLLGTVELSQDS